MSVGVGQQCVMWVLSTMTKCENLAEYTLSKADGRDRVYVCAQCAALLERDIRDGKLKHAGKPVGRDVVLASMEVQP